LAGLYSPELRLLMSAVAMTEQIPPTLKDHQVTLHGNGQYADRLRLRPLTEADWHLLHRWNNDPQVTYFSEEDTVASRSLEEVEQIYRTVSQKALCFIIELDGIPIGECWLQEMNLQHIRQKNPGLDCRRIDLMIGARQYWNRGAGTEVISSLTEYGFSQEHAQRIFGIVLSHNVRSKRAFEKVGYQESGRRALPPGGKAEFEIELSITSGLFGAHP
jgi:aminoglycoside 6'-N-acetyltransferase